MSPAAGSEFLLYQTPDGQARIRLRVQDGGVWLTQKQLAELYQASVPTINGHLRTLFRDGDLDMDRTIRKFRIVAREAERDVERLVEHYNLDDYHSAVDAWVCYDNAGGEPVMIAWGEKT